MHALRGMQTWLAYEYIFVCWIYILAISGWYPRPLWHHTAYVFPVHGSPLSFIQFYASSVNEIFVLGESRANFFNAKEPKNQTQLWIQLNHHCCAIFLFFPMKKKHQHHHQHQPLTEDKDIHGTCLIMFNGKGLTQSFSSQFTECLINNLTSHHKLLHYCHKYFRCSL